MYARPSRIVIVRFGGGPGLRACLASSPLTSARLAETLNAESVDLSVHPRSKIVMGKMSAQTISWTLYMSSQPSGSFAMSRRASATFGLAIARLSLLGQGDSGRGASRRMPSGPIT